MNQFALVIELLQTFSIKYSFLMFKDEVKTIFAEYPKKFALTNQPSSGEELPASRSLGPRGAVKGERAIKLYCKFYLKGRVWKNIS